MAIKKKRKGKTFVTEHYLSDEIREMIAGILIEVFTEYEQRKKQKLFVHDELMIWVDIQGFRYSTFSWKSFATTVPWGKLGISYDDRVKLFMEFSRIYEEHCGCDDPQSYHVKLNEETIYRVNDLFSL